jgi:hypothetical protein
MNGEIDVATTRAVNEARPWLIRFGRFGFAAKGVVYTLIGVLAVRAAVGAGGEVAGKIGVLEEISRAPFGRYLLAAIGIGIVGYALWRCIQAFMDTENKGSSAKGIAVRTGYFCIGLLYTGLAASAFRLSSGDWEDAGDAMQGWTARLMSHNFGEWAVAGAGIAVIAYGARQAYRGYTLKFRQKLRTSEMSAAERKWATRLGAIGYLSRAVVFWIVGVFLIVAVMHSDPNEVRGLDGALATLARQPWGPALLGIVALGLIAYGMYTFVEARYRRMVIDG